MKHMIYHWCSSDIFFCPCNSIYALCSTGVEEKWGKDWQGMWKSTFLLGLLLYMILGIVVDAYKIVDIGSVMPTITT